MMRNTSVIASKAKQSRQMKVFARASRDCFGLLAMTPRINYRMPTSINQIFHRKILNENIIILKKWVNNHRDLFSFIPPKAGGMVFLHYNMDINSTDLVTKIRKEKSTFIVAGDCFGMDHRLRIGIGSEMEYLWNGLQRIRETLNQFV